MLKYLKYRKIKYVELRDVSIKNPIKIKRKRIGKYSNEELKLIKQLLNQYEIEVSCLSSPLFNHDFPKNSNEKESMIAEFKRYCEIANILNSNIIRTFSFKPNPWNIERVYYSDQNTTNLNSDLKGNFYNQFKYICAFFKEIGDIAKNYGVKVALENEPKLFGNNVENSIKLIEEINHPSIGLLWDPGNMWRHYMDENPQQMKKMYKYVIYSHIKDVGTTKKGRRFHCVNGSGIIPYVEFFKDILELGYEFIFSVETHMHGFKWRNSVKCLDGLIKLLKQANWNVLH